MAMFVHIADGRVASSLRRTGIRLPPEHPRRPSGVFAMPILQSYFVSHQWLRELKRRGARTLIGVYFRIPDGEPVIVGHFREATRR
jgi:hypothetical protein